MTYVDHNDVSRKAMVVSYVQTLVADVTNRGGDYHRIEALDDAIADVRWTLERADQDLLDALAIVAAQSEAWMLQLLRERAR